VQPRQHKTTSFLSAHQVFTRAEFAVAFGRPASAANVTSLLRDHLRAGNIKRVSREVFAAVPAHLAADRMMIDRFAAASKLRADGVLGFHSALELHGIAIPSSTRSSSSARDGQSSWSCLSAPAVSSPRRRRW